MTFIKKLFFRLDLIFSFYKKLLVSSLGLSILLGFLSYPAEAILAIKIVLIGFIFLNYHFFEAKDRLLFYKNFGLTPIVIFGYCIFFDFILSVLVFKIFNLHL